MNKKTIEELSPIKKCEEKYPEMTSEFKKILNEEYELFCKKQLNYGPENIAIGTQLETIEEIRESLTGLWFRMNDKINRLRQLVLRGETDYVNENIEDSYQDLSVYGIIAQIVSRGRWGK